jgi:O6-methylguanine-DNA--protein-cysteine methyltransferase
VLIGTDWEVRVWEALLKIPMGRVATYSGIAETVCTPTAARAVGSGSRAERLRTSLAMRGRYWAKWNGRSL